MDIGSKKKWSDPFWKFAKPLIGIGLVYYVFRSKMIDFSTLQTLLWSPRHLMWGFAVICCSLLVCSARWLFLIRPQGMNLSYGNLIELTFVGNFFNTFMPGSVGGDVVKAWYVAGKEPTRKAKAVYTVFFDRVIGLAVIVFYSAVTLLFFPEWLQGNPQLKLVAICIWSFTALSFLVGFLFYTPWFWQLKWVKLGLDQLRKQKHLKIFIDSFLVYQSSFRTIATALLLSGISIFAMNLLYSFMGAEMGIQMDLPHYFFVVPLALTASAVPLLPGGIGVGQVAFFTLFKWVGVSNPDQGGALCTLIQIYTILFNCIGLFFYLKGKRHKVVASTSVG